MTSQEYSTVSQVENTEENQDNPPEYQVTNQLKVISNINKGCMCINSIIIS